MATYTISSSNSALTAEALLVTRFGGTMLTGNKVHQVIGQGYPDITFGTAQEVRYGSLDYLVASAATARTLQTLHTIPGTMTVTSSDGSLTMDYVASQVEASPHMETGLWTVTVEYQEVP